MTAKKQPAPAEPVEAPAEEPATPKDTQIGGGLAELQAKADAIVARGYIGSEKEDS